MIDWVLSGLCLFAGMLIIYHHAAYPILLRWYARRHPARQVAESSRCYKEAQQDCTLPTITILVPAFNEEQWIADKIRNLASLDYPKKKLEVIIACDGCTDKTVDIAQMTIQEAMCSDIHFEIHDHTQNRGKVAVVNEEVTNINSDITALSDVSALISLDALLIAAAHFESDAVGVVNATYQLCPTGNEGENTYWEYQTAVKQCEASLGSSLGSHGAFYLFRTHLFELLPLNTINDDFILPMQIVKQGYIAEYETQMVALELEESNLETDFKRRLRISAGNMQQAIRLFGLFSPKFKGIAFAFFSGKGLRLLTPYLMIVCLVCSILLKDYLLFEVLLWAQVVVYSIGLLGCILPKSLITKPISLISYLVVGHYANFIGGLRYLLGLENSPWTRANR
ncbi:Cellulose synthase/poly-beta-1,6-N-acetylglucosamine synthase-like glycosyltransferase [Vibrio crassostreae]|uniref:glycosyltransferase family 2 protein n=1 Tax=Vibrio crassostreae TaxID=246167 RepID=UPI0005E40DA1|nr:glycosyltransferase family 2 protein [Vibrio crassostreae]RPF18550.1 cellulose synthase/poly-beta-1,6-N-acetylglucosamine synthase-like glycosyltransferase [Vibrio crassostreae]TCT64421.1 cellulose synthase/poly-beta-1,6-N-acetylglucosamine synthase-like glycosyltransferase [Vibrio crassostreae]TCT84657.1 cellulose synthase/poly-beta-1,6-N-acetylglucosamine synthase-like glycosyltransferase [Vibrio crassostreae]TCU05680.1 cellulose synthase/poly-beta-1,6-N-acetylglucosamine synthase-like gly